jgi:ribonuclease P protein component
MLSQKHRLSKSADVKKSTARGRSFFNPFFVIKSLPNHQQVQLTVIASTKVSKKAVDRNRVKRIVRSELQKLLPIIKPGDYAILMKSSSVKATSVELREAINHSFKVGKILKQN